MADREFTVFLKGLESIEIRSIIQIEKTFLALRINGKNL